MRQIPQNAHAHSKRSAANSEKSILYRLISAFATGKKKYFVQLGRPPRNRALRTVLGATPDWTGLIVNMESRALSGSDWRELTGDEVLEMLQREQVPIKFSLLNVDIVRNAFHVLRIILRLYSPQVISVRYNANLGNIADNVVPYEPFASWDNTSYFGASFQAFCELARFFNYDPVCCGEDGRTIFLVHAEIREQILRESKTCQYRKSTSKYAHDKANRQYLTSSHYLFKGVKTIHSRYGWISYFSNDEFIGRHLAIGAYWQEHLLKRLGELHSDLNGVALDIGAHVGTHAIALARLFPRLTVMCFEPQEPLFRLLQRNIHENNLSHQLIPVHAAVAERSGTGYISKLISDGTSAGIPIEYGSDTLMNLGGVQLAPNGTACQLLSIDDLDLNRIVYAKIDVEGAEFLVLRGMRRTIRNHAPILVCESRMDRTLPLQTTETQGANKHQNCLPAERLKACGYRIEDHGGDFIGLPASSLKLTNNKTSPIPCRIFQTWKTKNSLPANFSSWSATFSSMNPAFEYELWDDDDNRRFIHSEFPWFLPIYDAYPAEIYRADAVRYFYLYTFGGVYADIDTECLKPIDSMLTLGDVVLGRMGQNPYFLHSIPNAIMASRPRQEFWLYVMALLTRASCNPGRPEFITGPVLLKGAVDRYLASESMWADSSMAAIASKLRSDQKPELKKSLVKIVESPLLYPIDWIEPSHQALRISILNGKLMDQEEKRRHFGESWMVTYWAHSWE